MIEEAESVQKILEDRLCQSHSVASHRRPLDRTGQGRAEGRLPEDDGAKTAS